MKPWIVITVSRPEMSSIIAANLHRQWNVWDGSCRSHEQRPFKVCIVAVGCGSEKLSDELLGMANTLIAVKKMLPGGARNAGLSFIKAKSPEASVIFWDDDDYYGSGYVHECVSVLARGIDFTFKNIAFIQTSDGNLWHTDVPQNQEAGITAGATIAVAKAKDAVLFADDMKLNEDVEWGNRMKESGLKGWCRSWFHFCHIRHGNNITGQNELDAVHRGKTVAKLGPFDADFIDEKRSLNDIKRIPCRKYWQVRLASPWTMT